MSRLRDCEVLTTSDASRWSEVLDQIGRHDFCHLHSYSRLAELSGHGRARMFVYRSGEHLLAFPLLLRDIDVTEVPGIQGTLRDVTSVYGYAGPLANRSDVSEDVSTRFMGSIDDYFREHRVVSALSRMHPLLDQGPILDRLGKAVPVGCTLSVDLLLPEAEQFSAYRRNHRQDIKRLRAMGVTCAEVGLERLEDFVAMYHDNMDRVKAATRYYFSRSYFEHLLADMGDVSHLFMCLHDGRPVAGSIFTLCQGFVQWHLSGSRTDFDGPPPTKLIFDVARRWAKERGAHTLHLGGGVGGSKDSLYHFKRGFTRREHVYSIWRHIADPDVYAELTRVMSELSGLEPDDGFFPLYRHPIFEQALARRDEVNTPGS